jgi:hypothetical protein
MHPETGPDGRDTPPQYDDTLLGLSRAATYLYLCAVLSPWLVMAAGLTVHLWASGPERMEWEYTLVVGAVLLSLATTAFGGIWILASPLRRASGVTRWLVVLSAAQTLICCAGL